MGSQHIEAGTQGGGSGRFAVVRQKVGGSEMLSGPSPWIPVLTCRELGIQYDKKEYFPLARTIRTEDPKRPRGGNHVDPSCPISNFNPAEPSRPRGARGGGATLRESWVAIIRLNGPWDWFFTLTFKWDLSEGQAVKSFSVWYGRLMDALYQKNGAVTRARLVRVTERTVNNRIHFHGLIGARCLGELSRLRWASRWENARPVNGFARILPAISRAAPYVTKYACKGSDVWCQGLRLDLRSA